LGLAGSIAVVAYFVYLKIAGAHRTGTIRSVAVLPFVNKTNDAEAEWLSEGIAESLINSLSQLPGVTVIARNSSFKYKGPNVNLQEAASKLGADAILTGTVSQVGDNLVISAELVNARENIQEWGDQYDRKRTDVLEVQAEISREIAQTLRLRLTPVKQQQLVKRETVNPQAYELVLKGRFSWEKQGTENRKKAVEYFNRQ
jgi:adenylate cyclase